jgi:hypothetical protein
MGAYMIYNDGEQIYNLAEWMVDRYNMRFSDMLSEDHGRDFLSRDYFIADVLSKYGELGLKDLDGYGAFKRKMREAGHSEWLDKIVANDSEKIIEIVERNLVKAEKYGDKEAVELGVKTLSGLVARGKLDSTGSSGGGGSFVINVIGVEGQEKKVKNGNN